MSIISAANKQYYFPVDIWKLIKEYMGINGGIDIGIIYEMKKMRIKNLSCMVFTIFINCYVELLNLQQQLKTRASILNIFYRKYRNYNTYQRKDINDKLYKYFENCKFRATHYGLFIGDEIYKYNAKTNKSFFGIICKITKRQFMIKQEDNKIRIIRDCEFLRKSQTDKYYWNNLKQKYT